MIYFHDKRSLFPIYPLARNTIVGLVADAWTFRLSTIHCTWIFGSSARRSLSHASHSFKNSEKT
jgi:hypothetical protein